MIFKCLNYNELLFWSRTQKNNQKGRPWTSGKAFLWLVFFLLLSTPVGSFSKKRALLEENQMKNGSDFCYVQKQKVQIKCGPLMIGKSKNPKAFKNVQIPVYYEAFGWLHKTLKLGFMTFLLKMFNNSKDSKVYHEMRYFW